MEYFFIYISRNKLTAHSNLCVLLQRQTCLNPKAHRKKNQSIILWVILLIVLFIFLLYLAFHGIKSNGNPFARTNYTESFIPVKY